MPRHREKQLRYGLTSGVLAFLAGWASVAILATEISFGQYPRWQTTLWVYLGEHSVELSEVYIDGLNLNTVDPLEFAKVPDFALTFPIITVAIAAFYTCYEMNSTRIKYNITNAVAAGAGYFFAALIAMIVSDIRPTISSMLILALVVGGGIWIGSSILGFLTRGLPFLGVASLGSIAALGIIVFLGGMAILSAIQGLVVISFGTAIIIGAGVGASRRLERHGGRHDAKYSRIQGLKIFLGDYWKEILIVIVILAALIFGITENPPALPNQTQVNLILVSS